VIALLGKPWSEEHGEIDYVVKVGSDAWFSFDQVFIIDVRLDSSGKVTRAFVRGD